MIPTAELLEALEKCPRKAEFSRFWSLKRLSSTQMIREALTVALRATGTQEWGEIAGSEVMALAEDRGIDLEGGHIYPAIINCACLADILASAIRKPKELPWDVPETLPNWDPGCFLSPDGRYLRRIVLVSSWNDARHYSECRGWFTMGEIAHYELPMQMIVLVIGSATNGIRRGPWCQGFLHPSGNGVLRFRKKIRGTLEPFKDSWKKVMREDHAEIRREKWLQAMLDDDVLPEVCFKVDVPVLDKIHRERILEMAKKKIDRINQIKELPEPQLSSCDWPLPCIFRRLCHSIPERMPSEANGFMRIG